ncbi:MAG TPA: hypothetical protein PK141_08575 [Polyangiaceae bacterium]|nr:hypothetical protein [Polyangiaceae bacterium]
MDAKSLALLAVPFVLTFGSAGLGWVWRRFRKRSALRRAALVLTDPVLDEERGVLTGRVGGRPVRCALTSRGKGSGASPWTEVTVTMEGPVLDFELRPQSLTETIDLHRGMAIDVQLGDPAFDRAFIVEGAPAAAVRAVFADAALRSALVELGSIDVTRTDDTLDLGAKGWLWGERLAKLAETAGRLAARVAEVSAEEARPAQSTYRPTPRDPTREAERRALADARATRKTKVGANTIAIIVFVVLFMVAWVAAVVAPRAPEPPGAPHTGE